MRNGFYCSLLLCALLFSGLPESGIAQATIGVRWHPGQSQAESLQQLQTIHKLGIRLIEIDRPPGEEIWNRLDSLTFTVYADLPISFPLATTFSKPDSSFIAAQSNLINSYTSHPSVAAIGLFRYGAVEDPDFSQAVYPYVSQIRNVFSASVYYVTSRVRQVSADSLFTFKILRYPPSSSHPTKDFTNRPGAYFYVPDKDAADQLKPVKTLLEKAYKDSTPVFFEAGWLLSTAKKYPEFEAAIQNYTQNDILLFPLPRQPESSGSAVHSFIVLLVLLVFGGFAFNYKLYPAYRRGIFRYFSGHKFFVDDIMHKHIRAIFPAIIILAQHALLSGILLYIVARLSFSPLGLDALQHYYPFIFSYGSFFIGGIFFAFAFSVLCILWLRILNGSIGQFRQALNLYAWPLHLNLLVGTLTTVLFLSGHYTTAVYIGSGIFAAFFIATFVIASIDTLPYLNRRRAFTMAATAGVYLVIFIGLCVLFLTSDKLIDVLQLGIQLS